jgi:putative transposase
VKRHVYVWADGVCLQAGSKMAGRIGAIFGSEAARAQCVAGLSIADRALGFWKAAGEIRPTMREQRWWMHKPRTSCQAAEGPAAKGQARQEIWMAETKADAEAAFDAFIESYQIKYKKQSNLNKDCDVLVNLRATSPIESTFATVR